MTVSGHDRLADIEAALEYGYGGVTDDAVVWLLAEVRRLRALLADLADVEPLALDQNQRPYCLSCGVNARWNDGTDGWTVDHYADCPWKLARVAL